MYDYVIIGSGISGLNLGYNLSKKYPKKNILILEKNNNIGGRIQSIYLHNNQHYEAGAIRFYPHHKNLIKLLKEFNYTKKDFYEIPHDYKRNIVIKKKVNKSETELNKILIENKNNFSNKELLNISFDNYSKKILSKEELHFLKTYNGFPHIFTNTSAYTGLEILKRDFQDIKKFYIMKTSLSEFLYKLVDFIQSNNNTINLNEEFLDFKKNNNLIKIKTNKNSYITKHLILAIPMNNLSSLGNKLIDKSLIKSVNQIPLCRIFSIFPNNNFWHKSVISTYTDNNIQRMFSNNSRLIQISYTSSKKAEFWNKIPQKELRNKLLLELKKTFPKKKIIKPDYLRSHYWENGIHLWNKNIIGKEISDKIIKPIPELNIYVCNEAYSYNQRWMEGSIEMSNRVYSLLIKS